MDMPLDAPAPTVSGTRLPPLDAPATDDKRPSVAELARRVRALVPAIREAAEATENNRRVSAEMTGRLKETGIYRTLLPQRFGGYEYSFTALMDIVFEAGRGCGSTAWCVGLGIVHQWLAATFPIEVQEEIWRDDPDTLVSGSYAPVTMARKVDGGYRIAGKWSFASNCDNSGWNLCGAMIPGDRDGERPQPGFLLVPRKDYEILNDWHTVGLSGTGSKTVYIKEEVFVPAHRRLLFGEASSNNPPGARAHKNPLYRLPFLSSVPVSITSPAFGMVQGAIEAFLDATSTRVTRGAVAGGGNRVAEFAQVQQKLAEATASLDAARLLLYRDIGEIEAAAARGEFITVDQRIRNRRDHAFAAQLCQRAIDAIFSCMGGQGMNLSHPVQRYWRDVHALSRHISLNWDWVGSMYGQYQLGLEPKGQF